MILIITSEKHRYTHDSVQEEATVDVRVLSYGDLKKQAKALPRGTYIFTDVDRLSLSSAREAANAYRALKRAGQKVLNDPARMLSRFGLLRALNRAGINEFDAYRVEDLETPRRWPVFLRVDAGHGEPVSGLLKNQKELRASLAENIDKGVLQSALLIIEYAAEPVAPGLFRKLSVFRVGDRFLGYTCVHDDQWVVKYGTPGIATPELYEEEYELVATHRFADAMQPIFEIAGVDYGRVDFGLVGGRPQIYEINSNPEVKLVPKPSEVAFRNESNALFRQNYLEAIREIDTFALASAATA